MKAITGASRPDEASRTRYPGLDLLEAEYLAARHEAASNESNLEGFAAARLGGAALIAAGGFDVLAFNRVVGLGLAEPASEDAIDEVVDFFRRAGASRFFVPLSPCARPAELPRWLERRGFRHYNNWVKLVRTFEDVPRSDSLFTSLPQEPAGADLVVEEVGPEARGVLTRIVAASFDMPQPLGALIAAPVGRPGWRFYLARAGDVPVAAAGSFVHGSRAALTVAGTLAAHRGRGAQGALIRRRLADAFGDGARCVTVETAEPIGEKGVPSYRNALRHGFEVAYIRPNYLYQF